MSLLRHLSVPSAETFWNSPAYSDYKLRYGHKLIYAHKVILCARSSYFQAMFGGNWKETNETTFHFPPDDDPEVVERMLQHIYECLPVAVVDYGNTDDNDEEERRLGGGRVYRDELLARIHEYGIGDRYGVPTLKRAAWAWCVDTSDKLRHEIARGRIVEPLELVYTQTPADDRLLRDLFQDLVSDDIKKLLRRADFRDLLLLQPQIALDLLKHKFSK